MMDVSGSMGDEQKEIVRIESFWIDTWLRSQYQGIESRYIVHDVSAKEVDKHTFYHLREDGGRGRGDGRRGGHHGRVTRPRPAKVPERSTFVRVRRRARRARTPARPGPVHVDPVRKEGESLGFEGQPGLPLRGGAGP